MRAPHAAGNQAVQRLVNSHGVSREGRGSAIQRFSTDGGRKAFRQPADIIEVEKDESETLSRKARPSYLSAPLMLQKADCNFFVYDSTESTKLGTMWAAGARARALGSWGGYAIASGDTIAIMLTRVLAKYDDEDCDCTEEIQFWSHGSAGNAMYISKSGDELTAADFNITDLDKYGDGPSIYDIVQNTPFYQAYTTWFGGLSRRQQLLVRFRQTLCGRSAEVYYRSCEAFQGRSGQEFAKASTEFWRSKVVGHTKIIGLTQPGKKTLKPGQDPFWSVEEGAGGTEHKKRGSKPKKY